MRFLKAFKLACFGLWANRVRVSFSMLGVVIGVLAIIILVSIGTGAEKTVTKQMNGLGSDQVTVIPGRVLQTNQGPQDFLNGMTNISSTLTYEDVQEIQKQPSVKNATPHLETVLRASYDKHAVEGIATGVTAGYKQVMHLKMASGRFLTDEDEQEKQRVVVLGSNIEKSLLGITQDKAKKTAQPQNPSIWSTIKDWLFGSAVSAANQENTLVGKDIQIRGKTFRVVGVLQAQNVMGSNINNAIIMPISMALETTNMKNLTTIYVQVKNKENLSQAQQEIAKAVRKHHPEKDFSVVEQTEMLQITNKITHVLQVMIIAIAAMAFLINGIGIMNVMSMSVRERTKEIGIRKTLGAKTRDILYQFFLETLLLTTGGGVIGLLLGYAAIELWNEHISAFSLVLPMWAIKLAIGSSFITGCVFGIYPALKAARLQPSRALRYGD